MRDFSYNDGHDPSVFEVEKIIRQRKRKIAYQQILYTIILLVIIATFVLWGIRKTLYIELDGHISTDVTNLRPDEDIFFLESGFEVGDIVLPGDTLFSYVLAHHFYKQDKFDAEPEMLTRNRSLRVDYGLARQDLEVLRVRIAELERQLETQTHNIRYGFSNNQNRMRIEQELAEAREAYASQRRKLGVLWNAVAQTEQGAQPLRSEGYTNLTLMDRHDIDLLKRLNLIRYSLAVDTCIITQKYVAAYTLVLRGEQMISTQSLDLRDNNLAVVTWVRPSDMKHINYNSVAEIKVNDEISYSAHVIMLGARTEEIPGYLRSSLSRDHTASVVVFGIDNNQDIPYWSLAHGVPIKARINKFMHREPQPDDYIIYNTSTGINPSVIEMRHDRQIRDRILKGRASRSRYLIVGDSVMPDSAGPGSASLPNAPSHPQSAAPRPKAR